MKATLGGKLKDKKQLEYYLAHCLAGSKNLFRNYESWIWTNFQLIILFLTKKTIQGLGQKLSWKIEFVVLELVVRSGEQDATQDWYITKVSFFGQCSDQ